MKEVIKMTFWQIIGFFRGILAAIFVPLSGIISISGVLMILTVAGIIDEKDEKQNLDLLAKWSSKGWKKFTGK